MLNNNKFQKLHNWCCSQFKFHFPRSIFKMMLVIGLSSSAYAQPNSNMYTSPSWWFGLGVGGNLNYFQGSTQQLNSALMAPVPFVEGNGLGLYAAPLIEYRPSNSHWGITLQGGIDSRYGEFKEVLSPCNCPRGLKTNLNYVTIEPSLRFRPFKGGLYIYGGPRISYILDKSFVYSQRNDPANSDQTPIDDITGDFDHIENVLYSMQIGAGYDILLSNEYHRSQFVLSPFVAFIPYLGREPRNIETWNITTVRAGAALKFGLGSFKNKEEPIELFRLKPEEIKHPKGHFKVTSPKNVVDEQAMRFSILYGFNNSTATDLYKRYLQQVVVPKIPAGSRVVIHGYTDKIGEDEYNLQLSIERSNDVFEIIKSELTRIGMEKVEFTVFGFGEDVALVPFENDTPEERFYNRTVIVDIIPQEK